MFNEVTLASALWMYRQDVWCSGNRLPSLHTQDDCQRIPSPASAKHFTSISGTISPLKTDEAANLQLQASILKFGLRLREHTSQLREIILESSSTTIVPWQRRAWVLINYIIISGTLDQLVEGFSHSFPPPVVVSKLGTQHLFILNILCTKFF